ncbi:unnamed protein product [Calypogeia fissa]
MEAYKSWVRQNRQWVSSFESLATTATWFLPERFTDSELTPEAVSTLLGLVTVMNQHIIETAPPSRGTGAGPHHAAQTEPKRDDSIPWSLCISVMKEMEVLIEMVAEYYLGKEKKWGPVASVEAIKALIRLIILKGNGYKMLLDGGETKNVGDIAPKDSNRGVSGSTPQQGFGRPVQSSPTMIPRRDGPNPGFYPRDLEGRAMQAMHKFNNNITGPSRPSWLRRPQELQEESQAPVAYNSGTASVERNMLESPKSRTFIGGEVLLISRPLLYVLLVWRYGLKSWRPWLAALSIDLAGMYLVSSSTSLPQRRLGLTGVANTQQGSRIPLSNTEALELRRRQIRWAFYLLRNPFFDQFTRRQVGAAEKILAPIPLVGMLAGKAVDLLLGVQGIYSYTAAS